MIIRWISLVPSKIVKILADMGRVIDIPARPPIGPCGWGTAALSSAAHGFPAAQVHSPLLMLAAAPVHDKRDNGQATARQSLPAIGARGRGVTT
jgi:hypothetical protein